ncbi:CTR copper uptake transporter [Pholiota molesta]|nr:CTR copper uptake transporter [Pholiota molesta]
MPHLPTQIPLALVLLSGAIHIVRAADNGMDMSMDGSMALAAGAMRPYLHFTFGGDTLWFLGWVPASRGAMAGACVGLFLLGVVDRWLAAVRAVAERAWRQREQISAANLLNASKASEKDRAGARQGIRNVLTLRTLPPFVASHDVVRGVLHAGQAALLYTFMLAIILSGWLVLLLRSVAVAASLLPVHATTTYYFASLSFWVAFGIIPGLTFNAAFLIAIVVGLGVGETLFGRFTSAAGLH